MLGANCFHGFQRDSGRRRKYRGISLLGSRGRYRAEQQSPMVVEVLDESPPSRTPEGVYSAPAPNFHAVIQGIARVVQGYSDLPHHAFTCGT